MSGRTAALGELVEVRRELREMRLYIEDDGLRSEVSDWIERSHRQSDSDSAREFVEGVLNQMLMDNEMYHSPTLTRPEEGFPSECVGCRHYGSSCPVLTDNVERNWRERRLEQSETESDARRVYQEQAIDVGCHRIPELLQEWDEGHADFIREGEELLSRVEDEILGTSETGAVATDGGVE